MMAVDDEWACAGSPAAPGAGIWTTAADRRLRVSPVALAARMRPAARAQARRLATSTFASAATLGLITLIVAIWFAERALIGHVYSGRTLGYLGFGALPNAPVSGRGSPDQWWRYVSSALVHDKSNPLHLAVNCCAVLVAGRLVERLYGSLVMLATFVITAAAGALVWVV